MTAAYYMTFLWQRHLQHYKLLSGLSNLKPVKNWTASLLQAESLCVLVKPYFVSGGISLSGCNGWLCLSIIHSHYLFKLFTIWASPMITLSAKLLFLLHKLCKLCLSTKSARPAEQERLADGDLQGICMRIKLRKRNEFTASNKPEPWANTFLNPFLFGRFYWFVSLQHNQC